MPTLQRDNGVRVMCMICGNSHGTKVCDETLALSAEIRKEAGKRDERLRQKCRFEQQTRSAILKEYGDPANWSA